MPSVLSYGTRKALIGSSVKGFAEERKVSLLVLCALALMIGVLTGSGAVAFRVLIALVHNLFFRGTLSVAYDANISEGPSPLGDFILLAPVIGGLVVVFLVRRFAPEAKGHGVPEVMDSIFYKRGKIRGTVALIKALASAVSIGSGAAVGREGPIIQIGSALGSAFAQFIGLSTRQRITLLSAGAGAGIAATFNTPLGGVLFALEILLPEVSNRTFLPVVVATGAATTIGRILIGPDPAFTVPDIQFSMVASFNVQEAIAFILLGVLSGAAAWAFIRLLVFMEDGFPKLSGNEYVQNIIGMSSIGLMMVALTHAYGHSYIDGVGYSVIQEILDHKMVAAGLLALLFVLKLVATTVSLGCGASGGIFSPSLYLGANSGRRFCRCKQLLSASFRADAIFGRDRRNGGHRRRRDGRRHDGDRDGVRNDARLRNHRSGYRCGSVGCRREACTRQRNDLHSQAAPPRAPHSKGTAYQPLSGEAGPGHHGKALYRRRGRYDTKTGYGCGRYR
ncbi:H+/Cl- antiporter ClcA [Bradyrhizobium sp. LB7.2]